MADRPTLNDLRTLSTMLPPSERVFAGEAADLVGAVVNVIAHGTGIIDAAKENGVQGVYDFFHNVQVDKAKEAGADEPIKGNPVHTESSAPAFVPPAQQSIDYDKLAAAIVKAQGDAGNKDVAASPAAPSVAEPTRPASATPPTENEAQSPAVTKSDDVTEGLL